MRRVARASWREFTRNPVLWLFVLAAMVLLFAQD